jgi:hypothetical protein
LDDEVDALGASDFFESPEDLLSLEELLLSVDLLSLEELLSEELELSLELLLAASFSRARRFVP